MIKTAILSLVVALTPLVSLAAIWGVDDTRHIWQSPAPQKELARSVAHLIPKTFVTENPDGTKNLELVPLSESWGLCKDEKWAKSLSVYVGCTGFVVGENLIMTAGHCMMNFGTMKDEASPFCEQFVWLFDFHEDSRGQMQTKNIPADRFAECDNVVVGAHNSESDWTTNQLTLRDDYALVRLKSPTQRPPLKVAADANLRPQEVLSMIGHPLGGPARTSKGRVLSEKETYWNTNLDSFPGNSGSPVLNRKQEVVGILVRGYPDSTGSPALNSCSRINRCKEDASSCQIEDRTYPYGEHVQKIPKDLLNHL